MEQSLKKKIGLVLATHRIKKGWTISRLSKKSNIRENKISLYELGQINFRFETLYKFSIVLECKISDFFIFSGSPHSRG